MSIRNLDAFFAPRAVALVLDKTTPPAMKQRAIANLTSLAGRAPVTIITRGAEGVQPVGLATLLTRLRDLPAAPTVAAPDSPALDLAILAGRVDQLADTARKLAQRGCRAVVILTPLMVAEASRQQVMDALSLVARQTGLRILGPGALGVLAPGCGLNASLVETAPKLGKVAVVAQSSTLGAALVDWACTHDVGFSHVVVLGDIVDVHLADILDKFALEPSVLAVLLHLEAVGNARAFMSAARAVARNKPVIALRAGRHNPVRAAASLHTAVLAGQDAAYEAALARAGVLRVRSLEEMFDAAETLAQAPRISCERLAILSNGAGVGVIAADELLDQGGTMATLSTKTRQALANLVPQGALTGNPIDLRADADGARYAAALVALQQDIGVDAVLAIHAPAGLSDPLETAGAVIKAGVPLRRKPLLLTSWIGGGRSIAARGALHAAGLPSYSLPTRAVRGFTHVVRWNQVQTQLMETPDALPQALTPDLSTARALLSRIVAQGRTDLDVQEAAELLACYDIPVAQAVRVQSAEAAVQAASQIGQPVALKIISAAIPHKRAVGGVLLGLKGARAVREGVERLEIEVRERAPGASIDGFLVQAMANQPDGRELILGLAQDPEFGPVVLFGHGGSAVEAIADTALALPPLNLKLAQDVIARTRVSRQLQAVGGMAAIDHRALCLTLVKLAHRCRGLRR